MSRNKHPVHLVGAETTDFSLFLSLPLSVSLSRCNWPRGLTVYDRGRSRPASVRARLAALSLSRTGACREKKWAYCVDDETMLCPRLGQRDGRPLVVGASAHFTVIFNVCLVTLAVLCDCCYAGQALLFSFLYRLRSVAVACYKWRLFVSIMSRYDMTWHLWHVMTFLFVWNSGALLTFCFLMRRV